MVAMEARVWRAGLALLLVVGLPAWSAATAAAVTCPRASAVDSILGPPEGECPALDDPAAGGEPIGVIEGDEVALQRALNLVHKNRDDYVAVLFYASWCPFSKLCRPNFNVLSSLFPTIRHFAFEESVIRPSILSSDVTGIKPASLDSMSVEKAVNMSDLSELKEDIEPENCPFSWARSPEKLLQEDTYLALASFFVLMRILYFLLPKLNACVKRVWRRHMRYASLTSFWDHSQEYLDQAKQGFNRLNPCKTSNLQEGAINATAWASKSLASVSIGEPSSARAHTACERR